jgi:secretion/DNA translocation related CpaE-like protein
VPRLWHSARFVVVDAASVGSLSRAGLDRRPDVVVVADRADGVEVWQAAVQLGAGCVLALPAESQALLDLIALAAEKSGPLGPLVGVVGGRGGAGASTVAVALGWAAAKRGSPATLVDLDAWGGGLDLPVGLEATDGLRWPDVASARGVVAAEALHAGLPRTGGLGVLAIGRHRAGEGAPGAVLDPQATSAVVAAARRGGGFVCADLPRWHEPAAWDVAGNCDAVVLVVTADVRAVAAAVPIRDKARAACREVSLVVRTESRARLRPDEASAALDLPLAATVRTDSAVAAAAERGELTAYLRRSRLGRSATTLLGQLTNGRGG